jgi:hypothetical protein
MREGVTVSPIPNDADEVFQTDEILWPHWRDILLVAFPLSTYFPIRSGVLQ